MENQQVLEEKSVVSLAIYSPPFMGNRKLGVLSVASLGESVPLGRASDWGEQGCFCEERLDVALSRGEGRTVLCSTEDIATVAGQGEGLLLPYLKRPGLGLLEGMDGQADAVQRGMVGDGVDGHAGIQRFVIGGGVATLGMMEAEIGSGGGKAIDGEAPAMRAALRERVEMEVDVALRVPYAIDIDGVVTHDGRRVAQILGRLQLIDACHIALRHEATDTAIAAVCTEARDGRADAIRRAVIRLDGGEHTLRITAQIDKLGDDGGIGFRFLIFILAACGKKRDKEGC